MSNIRNANGSGSVYKLSGNRRKPYAVSITLKTEYDEAKDKYILKRKILGYFATQQEARKFLANYNDAPCSPEQIDITFAEIWEQIKPSVFAKISKSRADCYDSAMKYILCKDKRIKDIRTQDLQKSIDACSHKSSTKQNIKTVMSKVFAYAMQNDLVSKDYSAFVTFEKDGVEIERKIYTPKEVETLWSNEGLWYIDLMLVLLYSGMRINEFLALNRQFIDLDNKTIELPRNIVKNDSSKRIVPIHNRIVPVLERFLSYGSDYVAAKPTGNRIIYKNFMKRENLLLEELLGARHTPHDTRHTFITRARECGCNNLVIQRIVGHTPETLTENIYTHLTQEELLEQVNLIEYC